MFIFLYEFTPLYRLPTLSAYVECDGRWVFGHVGESVYESFALVERFNGDVDGVW